MAIVTVPVRLDPQESLKLFKALESEQHGWWLNYNGNGKFDLVIDGIPTVHGVLLKTDGTWEVHSALEAYRNE